MLNFMYKLLIFISIHQVIKGFKYQMLWEENIHDCDHSKAGEKWSDYVDDSELNFDKIDDNTIEVEGNFKFIKTIRAGVWEGIAKAMYFEKGKWVDSPFHFIIPNACMEFHNPSKPWYNITNLFDKICPPKKGAVYKVPKQRYSLGFETGAQFPIGQWRGYLELADPNPILKRDKFCVAVTLSLLKNN